MKCLLKTLVAGALALSTVAYAQKGKAFDRGSACEKSDRKVQSITEECIHTADMGDKLVLLGRLYKLEAMRDLLGCPDVTVRECLCGGLLNIDSTDIVIEPPDSPLLPGETVQLSATITQHYCMGEHGELSCAATNPQGEPECSEDADLESHTLDGEVEWLSLDPDIAQVDQTGLVTASTENTGEAQIVAFSADLPDVQGNVVVEVIPLVDIAFVIDTTMSQYCNFYGDGCSHDYPRLPDHASSFYNRMNELFTDFTVGVFSYSVHSALCTDPTNYCGIPSGPCYASASHGVGIVSEKHLISAFNQLHTTCNDTSFCYDGPYVGTSMYSGLMRAISQYPWREGATRVIILIGGSPAGFYWDFHEAYNTLVEPISNISRQKVILSALREGISIYTINIEAWWECDPQGLGFPAIKREEHTALASATGGNYYPSSILLYGCYPPDNENILQALQDISAE